MQALCSSQGYTFLRLDGNTAKDQRQKMIDRFTKQNAIQNNVFLISTTAGGTGLNLQAASKVILYDVNWVRKRVAPRGCAVGPFRILRSWFTQRVKHYNEYPPAPSPSAEPCAGRAGGRQGVPDRTAEGGGGEDEQVFFLLGCDLV